MSEAATLTPPVDGTRDDLIRFYRGLAATPHTHADAVELRRRGFEGLTLLCAAPACGAHRRRRRWLVSTHFRAPRPKAGLRRI